MAPAKRHLLLLAVTFIVAAAAAAVEWNDEILEQLGGGAAAEHHTEPSTEEANTLKYLPPLIDISLHTACKELPEGFPVDFIYQKIEERFHFNNPEYDSFDAGEALPVNPKKSVVVVNDSDENAAYYTTLGEKRRRSLLLGETQQEAAADVHFSLEEEEDDRPSSRSLRMKYCGKCKKAHKCESMSLLLF